MIKITEGNLLRAEAEALVNTVNTVGVMGRGIALQFKKAFPDNFQAYQKACDQKQVRIGKMFIWENKGSVRPRYIINFPTKRHWRNKSRLVDIEKGLIDLVEVVRKYHISSIAVPPLGCGLGGLKWPDVRSRIEDAFGPLPDVEVLLYPPKGAPDAGNMVNRTKRPNMTHGRSALLGLMRRYLVPGYDYRLSLLEAQKLAYFLQETGEPLKLKFVKHHYGPYADNLRHVFNVMEGHFIRGFADGNNRPDTPIELMTNAVDQAEVFLKDYPDTKDRYHRVADLIHGFETPFGMELISSVHWVCMHEDEQSKSDPKRTVDQVLSWNERKRKIFIPRQIEIAWECLGERGWLSCDRM
jgi:O-acetyl-ADP-ribose deacetylase (regulator of RNase III)/uncharacterized protein YwgA